MAKPVTITAQKAVNSNYPELIDKLYDGAERIMRGEIRTKKTDMFGTTVDSFDVGVATFLMDARE